MDYYGILQELNYNGIMRKQASINKLFPTFGQRVDALASLGGVTLVEKMPETWHFKVPSSKGDGVKYDIYVRFVNIEETIKKYASDRRLWNKAETRVNLNLLAQEVLNNVDIETDCACPADLYWGGEYIKTQRSAQYDHPENRRPKKRNPKEYGMLCKHAELVFEVLPMFVGTFANFLKLYWIDIIDNSVEAASKDMTGYRAAAEELGRREKEQMLAKKTKGKGPRGEPTKDKGGPSKKEVPTAEPVDGGEEGEEIPTAEPLSGGEPVKQGADQPLRKHSKLPEPKHGKEAPPSRYSKLPEPGASKEAPLRTHSKLPTSSTKPGTKPIAKSNILATKRGTK